MSVGRKRNLTEKNLKIFLAVLGLTIVGLTIAITIINVNQNKTTEENATEELNNTEEKFIELRSAIDNETDTDRKAQLYIILASELSTLMKKTNQNTCEDIEESLSKAKQLDKEIDQELEHLILSPCLNDESPIYRGGGA